MSHKMVTKCGRRLVVYISEELRAELNGWVDSENISLADFTRDALGYHLSADFNAAIQAIQNRRDLCATGD